jgi:N-acyl-D-amino-acid deacylase
VALRRAYNPDVLRLVAVSLLAALAVQMDTMRPDYDLVILGARVLDGSGNPWYSADIAISGDRIVAVGSLPQVKATRAMRASGLTVAPGFIDVHSHAAEGLSDALNTGVPLLAQGVTTVVVNPDGGGPTDLKGQRAAFEAKGVGVNVAQFIGHGSVRQAVLGMADRAPRAEELSRMEGLVRAGMEAGAVGLSSGLYYAPGSYAKTEEVIALARVAAEFGGVYSSHIRDEADYSIGVVSAVQEVVRIAEEARVPGIVSHMKALGPAQWGLSAALTTRIDQARARGVQVYADQYPYEASGTGLSAALIPRWAQEGGRARFLERLAGADRERITTAVRENLARRGGAATLVVSSYGPDRGLEGRSLADVAKARQVDPADLVVSLLERGDGGLVSFNMSEADVAHIMRQPWTMTCSDGDLTVPGDGKPHPRGYGAFARKLGVYARDRGVVRLEDAIRSMTSLPAQVFGLKDRGVIRRGARADLVVFDPAAVRDTATYASPQQVAEGTRWVVVNGVVVVDEGKPTGATPGRVLSPERR